MLNVCTGSTNPLCIDFCVINANVYFNAVFWGGGDAYNAAQNCSSCP
jgi:hypothetical protein